MNAAGRNLVDCLGVGKSNPFVKEPNLKLFMFEDISDFQVQIITA
jgi:hypothetical protein